MQLWGEVRQSQQASGPLERRQDGHVGRLLPRGGVVLR